MSKYNMLLGLLGVLATYGAVPNQALPHPQVLQPNRSMQNNAHVVQPSQKKSRSQQPFANEKNIQFVLQKVLFEGNHAFNNAQLQLVFKSHIHKKISLSTLQKLVKTVTLLYKQKGYMLSHAYLPPQSIEKGVVKVHIVEGFIDHIVITGDLTKKHRQTIESLSNKLTQMRPLKNEALEDTMLRINAMPGLKARAVLGQSLKTGKAAQLTIVTRESKGPFFFQFHNAGNKLNHDRLMHIGYGIQQPTWGGQLMLHYGQAMNPDDYKSIALTETVPLSDHANLLRIHASRLKNKPNYLSIGLPTNGEKGLTKSIRVSLQHTLKTTRSKKFALTGSIVRNNSRFSNNIGNHFHDIVSKFETTMHLKWPTKFLWKGFASGTLSVSKGLEAFGARADLPSRDGGQLTFSKANITLHRHTFFGSHYAMVNDLYGQYSKNRLLASEEFSAGGFHCGRGYDSGELMGDKGYCRHHQFEIKKANADGRPVVVYLFHDKAKISNNQNTAASQVKNDHMSSHGFGVRWVPLTNVSLNVFLAKPLNHDVALENNRSPRYFFELNYYSG